MKCNHAMQRPRVLPQCGQRARAYVLWMRHMNCGKLITLTAMSALALSFVAGCERTVSQTEDTKVKSDGTVESKEKKVTENPDGTITKTETKKTEKP